MTQDEKHVHTIQKERKEKAAIQVKDVGMRRASLCDYEPAQWFDPKSNSWVKGVIACKHDQSGKRWAFAKSLYGSAFSMIPSDWLYSIPEADRAAFETSEWRQAVDKIRTHYDYKTNRRMLKRDARRMFSF